MQIQETLTNLKKLRAYAKTVPVEELKLMLDKLAIVVNERVEQEEKEAKEAEEAKQKIDLVLQQIKEQGLDINEVFSAMKQEVKTKPNREPRPAKYKYKQNGIEKTWTGQGRTPSAIQSKLDDGSATLDDFAI
jgi:DNA-binding protein H-NS